MPTLSVAELRTFTLDVLEMLGTPADFAEVVCNNLVGANLVGHDSHGVLRLITYAQFVRDGLVVPAAAPPSSGAATPRRTWTAAGAGAQWAHAWARRWQLPWPVNMAWGL